jgi:hypothetical protein
MRILGQIESGEINVEDAVLALQGADAGDRPAADDLKVGGKRFRIWWLLVLAIGLAVAGFGAWLGSLGGWWWLCAGPVLLVGLLASIVGIVSSDSVWVHVRVHTGKDQWPRRIAVSVPLPLRFTAWFLRVFGKLIPPLRDTSVDELLLVLQEGAASENRIIVDVTKGDTGERVEVSLG